MSNVQCLMTKQFSIFNLQFTNNFQFTNLQTRGQGDTKNAQCLMSKQGPETHGEKV